MSKETELDVEKEIVVQMELKTRRKVTIHIAPNPDNYVYVRFTPREAAIVSMILADTLTTEIADHFNISTERVEQIIQKAKRRVDFACERAKGENK